MAYETIINPDLAQLEQWYAQQQMRQPSRRLSDLALPPEQQQALMADLQQTQDPENAAIMQQMQPQPVQQAMPENYFQRTGGEPVPLQSIQQQGGMSLNDLLAKTGARIQDKVILSDRGVGYRTPYGSVAGLDSQGRMWEMDKPRTPAVTPKQMKEYWDMMKAQKDATMTPEDEARKVGLVEEAKTEAAKKAAAARAKIPGTQEYKRVKDQELKEQKLVGEAEGTKRFAMTQAASVKAAIANILGTTPEGLKDLLSSQEGLNKAERRTSAATGVIDVLTPTFFQNTANVEEHTKNLQDLAQMMGLTNLRKSNVAPGSITEREWPKFQAQLANISLRLGDKDFVKELVRAFKNADEFEQAGQLDYEKIVSELQQSGEQQQPAQGQPMQRPSNAQGQAQAIQEAMAAIQRGAPKEAVMQRLREMGIQ